MKRLPTLVLAALALVAGFAAHAASGATTALPRDSVYQLRAPMLDQSGRASAWRDQRGRPRVVSMFYSSCPYMCPLIVDSGKAIEHALSATEKSRLGITLVSIDPKRDTPRTLAALASKRKLDPTRWTLLQPAPGDVRAIAGVLAVRYRALANGEFNHTSVLILLDTDGRVIARSERVGSQLDPEFLAAVHRILAAPAAARTKF